MTFEAGNLVPNLFFIRTLAASLTAGLMLAAVPSSRVAQGSQDQAPPYGIVVMAHGGTPEWNQQIHDAVASIDATVPVEIAFGMADRASLEASIQAIEEKGVRNIAVVRLFISGDSFLEQTAYLLGLDATVPDFLFDSSRAGGMGPVPDPGAVPPIEHRSVVALSPTGLVEDDFTGRILAERALGLSIDAPSETVLVIAHGMGPEEDNSRLVQALEARAESIREAALFRVVEVVTLREDWEDKRVLAEARIRDIMTRGSEAGTVIVIPFRVAGFGPYAEVLDGFEYAADGTGLLPHDGMAEWIFSTGRNVACTEGWTTSQCH